MTGAISSIKQSGGCAHGLPAGACPVCSGGGGGGSVRKSGEMSWSDCYAEGLQIKAAKQRALDNTKLDQMAQMRTALLQKQSNVMNNQVQALNFTKALPIPAQNVINTINNIKQAISQNLIQFASAAMNKLALMKEKMQFMMNNFTNIADKLAAIFGEEANKIKDNVEKNLKKVKKKVFGFLEMIDGSLEQSEHEKAEEDQEDFNREIKDA